MEMTNNSQSFDNKAYVDEESIAKDANDNGVRKYSPKDEYTSYDNNNKHDNDEVNNITWKKIFLPNFLPHLGTSKVKDMSRAEIRYEKWRIMKNVVVISFAFLLLFTAFQSMSALQSSINKVSSI